MSRLATSSWAYAAPEAERGAPIAARGLVRSFGAKRVLRGLEPDVAAGEFVAVVGRSGCGKAGLDSPCHGRIVVGEGEMRAIARVMFQEPRLLPWASTLANVEVGLSAERRSAAGSRAGA
jgi:sulfonate transport system ATP-binding protein